MARPPNLKNSNHPLRLLRNLLSEQGAAAPMSQLKFSQLIDVPVSTIKAIENGQRLSNQSVREHIALATGAVWSKQKEQWMYVLPEPAAPFTFLSYLEFQQIMGVRPRNDRAEVAKSMAALRRLFEKIPDKYWHRLYWRFQDFIERNRAEIEELKAAAPRQVR
jgi:transcriptional regulator with XRE-family HTH domain